MLQASGRPLHEVYDTALLDLDGVLYRGADPIEHAAASVAQARAAGMRCAFVTNNTSRRPTVVAAHLNELGIPADPADVVTSGQAAVRWLVARLEPGAAVLVLGTDGLADEVAAGGLLPVRSAAGSSTGTSTVVSAVVQGLAPTTSWADLAEACVAIRAGALWVAGNTDATYPSPRGILPGNGAMVAALELATGQRPVVVGKPAPELHQASVERVAAQRPLVVGDRLDTDVLGAVRVGVPCLLVLTGVTDREQLLAAPDGMRPSYLSSDLRGLLRAHEAPVLTADGARCGSGTAWFEAGTLRTSDEGDDALRAACALAWSGHR